MKIFRLNILKQVIFCSFFTLFFALSLADFVLAEDDNLAENSQEEVSYVDSTLMPWRNNITPQKSNNNIVRIQKDVNEKDFTAEEKNLIATKVKELLQKSEEVKMEVVVYFYAPESTSNLDDELYSQRAALIMNKIHRELENISFSQMKSVQLFLKKDENYSPVIFFIDINRQ